MSVEVKFTIVRLRSRPTLFPWISRALICVLTTVVHCCSPASCYLSWVAPWDWTGARHGREGEEAAARDEQAGRGEPEEAAAGPARRWRRSVAAGYAEPPRAQLGFPIQLQWPGPGDGFGLPRHDRSRRRKGIREAMPALAQGHADNAAG